MLLRLPFVVLVPCDFLFCLLSCLKLWTSDNCLYHFFSFSLTVQLWFRWDAPLKSSALTSLPSQSVVLHDYWTHHISTTASLSSNVPGNQNIAPYPMWATKQTKKINKKIGTLICSFCCGGKKKRIYERIPQNTETLNRSLCFKRSYLITSLLTDPPFMVPSNCCSWRFILFVGVWFFFLFSQASPGFNTAETLPVCSLTPLWSSFHQSVARRNFAPGLGGSDVCHFCTKRVYVMERLSAEGYFFHRECFRCDVCNCTLRLGGHAFDSQEGTFDRLRLWLLAELAGGRVFILQIITADSLSFLSLNV